MLSSQKEVVYNVVIQEPLGSSDQLNPIVNSIVRGDVYCTSALRIQWISQLYNM